MTIVTNHDGTYVCNDPAEHCRHGVYVGGMGYDFMCWRCEDDSDDPTPAEFHDDFHAAVETLTEIWTDFLGPEPKVDLTGVSHELRIELVESISRDAADDLDKAWKNYQAATKWADGPDDTQWLHKRWKAEAAAHHAQTI